MVARFEELKAKTKPIKPIGYLAIGNFDLFHKGHLKLSEGKWGVSYLTFINIPRKSENPVYNLYNKLQNIATMSCSGNIYYLDIKKNNMDGLSFIKLLKSTLNPDTILVGEDFKFGNDFKDVNFLSKYFNVDVTERDKKYDTIKIKKLIMAGDVKKAYEYLPFPFMIYGKSVKGKQLGRKLGYPTVNVVREKGLMKIKPGVYLGVMFLNTASRRELKCYTCAISIMDRKCGGQLIESHSISGDLNLHYGSDVEVSLHKYVCGLKSAKGFDQLKKVVGDCVNQVKKELMN